ncbi:MAG: recombinase, partial [Pseudomonadota bacterium]
TALINAADPQASRAERHLWLVRWLEWLRSPHARRSTDGPAGTPDWTQQRLRLFLNMLDTQPTQRAKLVTLLRRFLTENDAAGLWVDMGFSPRTNFLNELGERLRLTWVPRTPDTDNLGELFLLLFPSAESAHWLAKLDDDTLARLSSLCAESLAEPARHALLDALSLLASHIHLLAYSPDLRHRLSQGTSALKPFQQLPDVVRQLRVATEASDTLGALQATNYLRAVLDECRRAEDHVNSHLDENGISVDVIFLMDQLRERTERMDLLLTLLNAPRPAPEFIRAIIQLAEGARTRRSVRNLFTHHYALMARKMAQRHADTGDHYISRTRSEYFSMLRRALIGGVVIALTTGAKFALSALTLPLFWGGMAAGFNYSMSFVVIHLLHGTVATKQPAMTAPAMAGRLVGIHESDEALQGFVDEVGHLLRSQCVGILGNLLAVIPVVLAAQGIAWAVWGAPLISSDTAQHVLHANSLFGPTPLYAAFTGILLFAGSLMAGWLENWFVLHRLDSALAWNPRMQSWLGAARAQRWARWWRENISALASSVTLGLLLGLVPVLANFVGLPLDVRHVTLATGQVVAAAGTEGWAVLRQPDFWGCVAAIPVIGACNLGVSFWLAFRLALRARKIRVSDRRRVRRAVWRSLLIDPWRWLVPSKA